MWIYLTLFSALMLGIYDVCKKHALNGNAVLPVLFLSILSGFLPMLIVLVFSRTTPEIMQQIQLFVPVAGASQHMRIFIKAVIVSTSWALAFFAMKHLPISIVSPIRASGPMWTMIGALILFHERPALLQWAGIAVVFASYFAFSFIGRSEGLVFHHNRWIACIFLATLTGAASALYDKHLLHQLHFDPMLVQFWFSFYNMLLTGLLTAFFWWPQRAEFTPFRWRWSIPAIGLLLVVADIVYFHAVRQPEALILIVSLVRRCSVVVSFVAGAIIFGEVNRRRKAWALAGVLAGVALIMLA